MQLLQIKTFQWRYSLLLMPIVLWLPTGNTQAATTFDCTASVSDVNLGNITPANADNSNLNSIQVNWSCTNTGTDSGYVSICLGVDGGLSDPSLIIPRYMSTESSNVSSLAFTMTRANSGTVLGRRTISPDLEFTTFSYVVPGTPKSGFFRMNVTLLPGYSNKLATQALYTADFTGANTAITYSQTENGDPNTKCKSETEGTRRFPFKVKATVIDSCEITAKPSDIDLGTVSASVIDTTGSTSIGITCTNDAHYNIGLAAISSNKIDGSGIMSGTSGNSDLVPYQLRSADGTAWGNNGSTYSTLTNGVLGQGNGAVQSHTVHVIVPSADFKPDHYSDIVTISVNY